MLRLAGPALRAAAAARRRSSATRAPRRTRRRSRSRARRRAAPRIVALEGGFHGRTLGALSATGQPAKWEGFGPLVPGVTFARPNDVESLEAAVSPGGELAAIILEPVLGEGGVVPLEQEFVQAAAEIAREVGALLCVDEVQTGLGRTGTFFAYEQLGIEPDLVTLAKGLGNGLPIGALLVRDGVADAIGPGDHGSTFGGNPVACAAACAVVEAIDDALLADVVARGAQLADGSPAAARRRRGARPRAARRRRSSTARPGRSSTRAATRACSSSPRAPTSCACSRRSSSRRRRSTRRSAILERSSR